MKRSRRIPLPAAALAGAGPPGLGPLFAERSDAGGPAPAAQPSGRDDNAALQTVLDLYGRFRPALPDPPWADPRPDLAGDHARWELVLELAYHRDAADPEGVYGALCGVRCCGARIEHADDNWTLTAEGPPPRWRLVRGEIPADEWAQIRTRWLLAHRTALEEILLGPRP